MLDSCSDYCASICYLQPFTIPCTAKYKILHDKGNKIKVICMLHVFVTSVFRTDLSEVQKRELSAWGKYVIYLCHEECSCVLGKGQSCLEYSEYTCTSSKDFLWYFFRLVRKCKCYVLQKRLQQQIEGRRRKFLLILWKYVSGTEKLNLTCSVRGTKCGDWKEFWYGGYK